MIQGRIIRISAPTLSEVEEVTRLLQDCLDRVHISDLKKLLSAVNKNPGIVKTAIKFI